MLNDAPSTSLLRSHSVNSWPRWLSTSRHIDEWKHVGILGSRFSETEVMNQELITEN